MKTTTLAKVILAVILVAVLAIIAWLVLEIIDYRPSSPGPEYETYNWHVVIIPTPKRLLPWLDK